MAGPPENVAASDLWRALQELPRPSKLVDFPRCFPGTDKPIGQLIIVPLSQAEQVASNAEADRFSKKLLKDAQRREDTNLGYESIYSNEVAVQVLFRACRDANSINQPAFPTPAVFREKVNADEVGALFRLYCQVQIELGPILTRMSDAEMEAWIEKLEEGGQHEPFAFFSLEAQLRLVSFMASQIISLRTAIRSAGSPQETGDPDESPSAEEPDVAEDDPIATPE